MQTARQGARMSGETPSAIPPRGTMAIEVWLMRVLKTHPGSRTGDLAKASGGAAIRQVAEYLERRGRVREEHGRWWLTQANGVGVSSAGQPVAPECGVESTPPLAPAEERTADVSTVADSEAGPKCGDPEGGGSLQPAPASCENGRGPGPPDVNELAAMGLAVTDAGLMQVTAGGVGRLRAVLCRDVDHWPTKRELGLAALAYGPVAAGPLRDIVGGEPLQVLAPDIRCHSVVGWWSGTVKMYRLTTVDAGAQFRPPDLRTDAERICADIHIEVARASEHAASVGADGKPASSVQRAHDVGWSVGFEQGVRLALGVARRLVEAA